MFNDKKPNNCKAFNSEQLTPSIQEMFDNTNSQYSSYDDENESFLGLEKIFGTKNSDEIRDGATLTKNTTPITAENSETLARIQAEREGKGAAALASMTRNVNAKNYKEKKPFFANLFNSLSGKGGLLDGIGEALAGKSGGSTLSTADNPKWIEDVTVTNKKKGLTGQQILFYSIIAIVVILLAYMAFKKKK